MDWMRWKRPYFTIHIRPVDCRYEVRINDMPVDKMEESLNTVLDIPVNPSVYTGRNFLAAVVQPADEEAEDFGLQTQCEISLCVRELDGDPREREIVDSLVFRAADLARPNGTGIESTPNLLGESRPRATRIDPTTILVQRTIRLETPFPPWLWKIAPRIADPEQAIPELLGEYRKFHAALAAKDLDGVSALTHAKAREIAIAYYGEEEEGHQLIEFREKMNDAGMELWRLEEDDLTLEVFANRRMARFVTGRGYGPILYKMKDQPIAAYMNTSYCRDPKGGWIQIR